MTESFADWIGRREVAHDAVTERLVREFDATLAPYLFAGRPDVSPLLIHWCLAPPARPLPELGRDGHPAKGGFLPPIPLPRRMWAGGSVEFLDDLRVGDAVTRTSTIARVENKTGRSGELWFVDVAHEIVTDRGPAVRETQTIVYRPEQGSAARPIAPTVAEGAREMPVELPNVRLFRYSALTFNGHRIHYDLEYATGVEGYEGLVVRGPLQATLLAHAAATLAGEPPRRFRFRGVAPLIAGRPASLRVSRSGGDAKCCVNNADGGMTMEATASWD
jgi:3-methylfumaryl-CoA hydratase